MALNVDLTGHKPKLETTLSDQSVANSRFMSHLVPTRHKPEASTKNRNGYQVQAPVEMQQKCAEPCRNGAVSQKC